MRAAVFATLTLAAVLTAEDASACSKYGGQTKSDHQIAYRICTGYYKQGIRDVEYIHVSSKPNIIGARVSPSSWQAMRRDVAGTRRFASELIEALRSHTRGPRGTAWVYVGSVHALEAKWNVLTGVELKWLAR